MLKTSEDFGTFFLGLEGHPVIRISGSRNKPGCSAGDSIPQSSGFFGIESEKKYILGTFVLCTVCSDYFPILALVLSLEARATAAWRPKAD